MEKNLDYEALFAIVNGLGLAQDIKLPFMLVSEEQFEPLLESGFRMMSQFYFRHTSSFLQGRSARVKSLRIRLADFTLSKSHRKILRTHDSAFTTTLGPIKISQEEVELFERHCKRFPPEYHNMNMYIFLNSSSDSIPVRGLSQKVYLDGKLIAASYIHLGGTSMSATYGIHDPSFTSFSLGTYTMLKELQLAQKYGLTYYYHGYAYDQPSQFDYKFNFNALECLDWESMTWKPHERIALRNWRELSALIDEQHV